MGDRAGVLDVSISKEPDANRRWDGGRRPNSRGVSVRLEVTPQGFPTQKPRRRPHGNSRANEGVAAPDAFHGFEGCHRLEQGPPELDRLKGRPSRIDRQLCADAGLVNSGDLQLRFAVERSLQIGRVELRDVDRVREERGEAGAFGQIGDLQRVDTGPPGLEVVEIGVESGPGFTGLPPQPGPGTDVRAAGEVSIHRYGFRSDDLGVAIGQPLQELGVGPSEG